MLLYKHIRSRAGHTDFYGALVHHIGGGLWGHKCLMWGELVHDLRQDNWGNKIECSTIDMSYRVFK